MVLMAEGHRLRLHHAGVGDVRRALQSAHRPKQPGHNENRPKNRWRGKVCWCCGEKSASNDTFKVRECSLLPLGSLRDSVLCSQMAVTALTKTCDYTSRYML